MVTKKSNKILGIIYQGNDWERAVPNWKNSQRNAYQLFYQTAKEKYNINIHRVALSWYNNGTFSKSWTWTGNTWVKIFKPICPDILLDWSKTIEDSHNIKRRISSRFIMTNPIDFQTIVDDKLITNITFSEMSIPSYIVQRQEDMKDIIVKVKTKLIVLKPRFGSSGNGIKIILKKQALREKISGLTIVEPFLDSSSGVPGIYKGTHDFRVLVAGEKPFASFIRTPAPGTKLCNVAQGGDIIPVSLSKIPASIKIKLKIIAEKFKPFPYKIYSADFFFQGNTPFLIELNSKSMISLPAEFAGLQAQIQDGYLQYLSSIVS